MTPTKIAVSCISIVFLGYVITTLAVLALYPYGSDPGFSTVLSGSHALGAPLSLVFLFGILYFWIIQLAKRKSTHFSSFIHHFSVYLVDRIGLVRTKKSSSTSRDDAFDSFSILPRPWLLLTISLATSLFLAWLPYRSDLNPSGVLVGIDTPQYLGWITQMLSMSPTNAIVFSFVQGLNGSRPFFLLAVYAVCLAGGSPSSAIKLLPVFLAPLLSLSVYLFTYIGKGDPKLAALTSLFVSCSTYFTVGMWGGYYANWLALSISLAFLACLLMYSRSSSLKPYSLMMILSAALFLTHPWTWFLTIFASAAFAFTLWLETRGPAHVKSLVGMMIPGLVGDILKSVTFSTPSVALDLLGKLHLDLGSIANLWGLTVEGVLYTHSGLLGNWLLLGLAFVGVLAGRIKGSFERLLIFWIAGASIPFLFLDSYNKARVVYDLPIPILSSIGAAFLVRQIGSYDTRTARIWLVSIVALNAAYALQGMLTL